MNYKKILVTLFSIISGQELMSSTGALVRQNISKPIVQNISPLIPTLISAKTKFSNPSGQNNISVLLETKEISKATFKKYSEAFIEAMQWSRHKVKTGLWGQGYRDRIEDFEDQKFNFSAAESKAFIDLQLSQILKNKTIDSTTFWSSMIALAAMFGFYKLVDFLNNLYEGNTILMWAVEADNENAVTFLLALGADIHKKNEYGDTAMIIAAHFGNFKMVELLITKTKEKYKDNPEKAKEEITALLNTKNNEGRSALLEVVKYGKFLNGGEFADPTEKGRIDTLQIFLENGVDLTVQDNNGDNVLFLLTSKMSAVSNDENSKTLRELFSILADEDPSLLQAVNNQKENLLNMAVINSDIYAFNFLKNQVIDVMNTDENGKNILFQAIESKEKSKSINLVKAVLDLLEEKLTMAVLFEANSTSNNNFLLRLTGKFQEVNPKGTIVSGLKKESVNSKLTEFLQVKDKQGLTVLDVAVFKSSFSVVQLLIEKGASPTPTLFSYVVSRQDINMVKLFLDTSKISPSQKDLMMVYQQRNIPLLKVLLNSKNISLELKNNFIFYLLMTSIEKQDTEVVDWLLPSLDPSMQKHIVKNVILTGNSSIIKDFLKLPQMTDEIRRDMLKEAVVSSKSAETIKILLDNPACVHAYQDPTLRDLVLREALRQIKSGDVKGVMLNDLNISEEDLKHDPIFKTLLIAWEPKQQEGWTTTLWDKYYQLRGQKGSKEDLKEQKLKFQRELYHMLHDENQNRKQAYKDKSQVLEKEAAKNKADKKAMLDKLTQKLTQKYIGILEKIK